MEARIGLKSAYAEQAPAGSSCRWMINLLASLNPLDDWLKRTLA
jgi:hypothetical protein